MTNPTPIPDLPPCRNCAQTAYKRAGAVRGYPHYRCKTCNTLAPITPDRRPKGQACPYCGAHCYRTKEHKPSLLAYKQCYPAKPRPRVGYICSECHRTNRDLMPENRVEDIGSHKCRVKINLDFGAQHDLNTVCQHFGMSESEAVRAVFRASLRVALPDNLLPGVATVQLQPVPPSELPERIADLPRRLPRAHRDVTTARIAGRPVTEACHTKTVCVVQKLSVALCAPAHVALYRAMTLLGTRNRQDAARYLLHGCFARFDKHITIPELLAPERRRHKTHPATNTGAV